MRAYQRLEKYCEQRQQCRVEHGELPKRAHIGGASEEEDDGTKGSAERPTEVGKEEGECGSAAAMRAGNECTSACVCSAR